MHELPLSNIGSHGIKTLKGWLRTESYSGIQDANNAGDFNAESIVRRDIWPSSFTGGLHYMMQHY